MNIFIFMSENQRLTFLLALIIAVVFVKIVIGVMKYLNIRQHGYPPVVCNADEDFKLSDD